jgi:DNA-binding transcriptional LysR family regulator
LRANNSEVLRDAVLGGLGIALLPDFSAAGHLGPRELAPVLPQWRPLGFFGDAIYAIRPWSAQVPRAVQCLVDHLRAALVKGFSGPA